MAVSKDSMRRLMGALSRRNVIAMAAGVMLAGAPLLALNLWVHRLVTEQAQAELTAAGRRAAALADARMGAALTLLEQLSAKGFSTCNQSTVDALRRATFRAAPVKQVAILSAEGRTLCSDVDLDGKTISTHRVPNYPKMSLEIVQLAGGGTVLRLRRQHGAGAHDLAAAVPVSLLLPQIGVDGNPLRAYAVILAPDGKPIGAAGTPPPDRLKSLTVKVRSSGFAFQVEITAPAGMLPAANASLRWFGTLTGCLVVLALGAVLLIFRRRAPGDPVADLARALKAGEFVPYYQPIVDIRSGQLRGAEVLVRWRKPDGSLVLPGAFIPLAESSGLIREMTRDLMRRVCIEAGATLGCRPQLKISFNFAAKLFGEQTIVNDVRKIFSASPIQMQQVVLEVTERDPIENFCQARQVIAALQAMGVRIAIDDVGTGHSGLSYMLKLGVDIIKIDKMFVDAIGSDRNSTTIVETLVDLAHNMRMDVVAEGVENFEQVMHLREVGIRSAQGYVFAPPLPGSAFLQLVEAIDPLPATTAAAA